MDAKKYIALLFYRFRYKIQEWKLRISQKFYELDLKGREKLTVMVIPHTESRTINFVISYKTITIFIIAVVILIFTSVLNVLSHSGSIHELTELNLSNIDFQRQSEKLSEEVQSLHETVTYYYDRISNLYLKLGGDPSKVSKGMGGASPKLTEFYQKEILPASVTEETYHIKEDIHNLKISRELSQEIIKILKKKKSIIRHTPSIWPVKGYVLFPYGKYVSPITGKEEFNSGIGIAAFPGSKVYATASGLIYDIGYNKDSGYYVKIAHKYGWKTIYSNLERLKVQKNDIVNKGDVIGFIGKTSYIPIHYLHYEVHVGTQTLNPFAFLNQIQK